MICLCYLAHIMAADKLATQGDKTAIATSPPSATYIRQWIGSALVQTMASCLFGAKPLSKLMLGYCQLNREEHTSVNF